MAIFSRRSPRKKMNASSHNSRHSTSRNPTSRHPRDRALRGEQLEDRRMLAVITVNTVADVIDFNYRATSLREAIFAANTVPGPDEIVFDFPFRTPAKIVLTEGELQITDSLTITGPGAELLTIDASGNDPTPDEDNGDGSRVFNIDDDQTGLIDVELLGLTLTGGDLPFASSGGGSVYSSENLTVRASVLIGNHHARSGGAILTTWSGSPSEDHRLLRVIDCELSHNRSREGAAIRSSITTVTIVGTTISNNIGDLYGGALTSIRGDVSFVESNINNNSAGIAGGGIEMLAGTLSITGSTVSNNSVTDDGSGRGGGGIYFGGKALTISASSVSGNSTAGDRSAGGGVYVSRFTSARITISESSISNNSTVGNSSSGGGLYVHGPRDFHFAEISDSTISGNSTSGESSQGAGIFVTETDLHISHSQIYDNSATGTDSVGGGIYNSTGTATVVASEIYNNTAASHGGGIHHFGTELTIADSLIAENTSSGSGGGIYYRLLVSGPILIVADDQPLAAGYSSIKPEEINLYIQRSTISNNRASNNGGGIAGTNSIQFALLNSTISGNVAENRGGGVYLEHGNAESPLSRSTITENSSGDAGGGVFVMQGSLQLDHTIVAENTSSSFGHDITGFLGAVITPRYSLIGNSAGSGLTRAPIGSPDDEGNLIGGPSSRTEINPRLGPLADNGGPTPTHALLSVSPAIGAGDPALLQGDAGTPEFDQRGAPFARVAEGRIDIGAFELQPEEGILSADFDTDGDTDGSDFLAWQRGYGTIDASASDGDATGDGDVDHNDLAVWQTTFPENRGSRLIASNARFRADAADASKDFTETSDELFVLLALSMTEKSLPSPGQLMRTAPNSTKQTIPLELLAATNPIDNSSRARPIEPTVEAALHFDDEEDEADRRSVETTLDAIFASY